MVHLHGGMNWKGFTHTKRGLKQGVVLTPNSFTEQCEWRFQGGQVILKEEWSLIKVVLQQGFHWWSTGVVSLQGFCWPLYRGGLSSGILLSPIQGWSLIRVVSHKGFYWLQYRGGLLSGWSLTRVLLAPIQWCLEVFIGSCTGVVFHWVSLLHFYFFYWFLHRGGLSSGWSLMGFTGSCTGAVFHWGGLLHQGFYWLLHSGGLSSGWSLRGFTGSCTGVSLIRVVLHQGFYWLLHRGGLLHQVFYWLLHGGGLSLGWSLIWDILHQGFYWLLYSSGVLLAPV